MKLTEDEQEQMKLENYKMMSAISGKNLNDFIGNSDKNNYSENDCLIKQLYLKNMVNPISSRELYDVLKTQGYNRNNSTFRVMLNQYQKYEYVRKVNSKKPFLYQITELGYKHVKDPYIARMENIRRYKDFQNTKLKQLIEEYPSVFKELYESIFGIQNSILGATSGGYVSPVGATSHSPDIGSEEIKEELENKIYSSDFWKNSNDDKLESLIDGILDPCLSDEDRKELILNMLDKAMKSNKTMVFKQQEYHSNPVGERKYYEILVRCIDQRVSKQTYEVIPFRFIYVQSKKELRLEAKHIAGKYRNNADAEEKSFEEVNSRIFSNMMTMRTKIDSEKREITFFYGSGKMGNVMTTPAKYVITTMSFDDYNNAKSKNVNTTLKIIPK
jgi:hypothetical protein